MNYSIVHAHNVRHGIHTTKMVRLHQVGEQVMVILNIIETN